MTAKLKITINKKTYFASPGETILDVARRNDLFIPTLCKHPDLSIQGKCRVCLVELADGQLVTACSTPVASGMLVKTDTPAVDRARRVNLEMIYAEHIEKCSSCIEEYNCPLKDYAQRYGAKITRYEDRKKNHPLWHFGALPAEDLAKLQSKIAASNATEDKELRLQQSRLLGAGYIQFDASKCIDCGICTEICRDHQAVDFYETVAKGAETLTKPKDSSAHDCVYCGQCIVHCPVGAIQGVPHWPEVEKLLADKKKSNKLLVAQIAPSVRVSIGEEFGMSYGQAVTGQLATAIRKLGFDLAFDVTLGADFTTYEEARELIHWLASGKSRPMFTSCCPGWVKFVEFYYPGFISHLTTTRSPEIISGVLAKTYYADLIKKEAREIIVVSVMPCTAKKNEISLARHAIDPGWCTERLGLAEHDIAAHCFIKRNKPQTAASLPIVDYVLTVREFAYLLKRHKIDLSKLKPSRFDSPLGEHSGAAVIYGASGGVMESALRTADAFLRVKKKLGSLDPVLLGANYEKYKIKLGKISGQRLEFKAVRGMRGIKEARLNIGGVPLKVAVVNGLGNAARLLQALQNKQARYDYVEVMACPGGCIGGGGQPVPVTADIRAKRAAALYQIDQKSRIRAAHDNSSLLEVYHHYFRGDEVIIDNLLHCDYRSRDKSRGYERIN